MSNSSSNYTSLPLKTPTADAWGYLSTPSTVVEHSGVSQFGRVSNGFYGVTFTSPNRFLSGAYVVIATPEYAHDTDYGPVMCRIANAAGSTALGRSAGFQLNTFENSGSFTPNRLVLTNRGVTIGFAAFSFSQNSTAYVVGSSDFVIVPGASGYGVTGATYNSQLTSLNSRRAATAYGTVVIPNRRALGISAGAYLENTFNVRGVSAGTSQSVFDITFEKPLNNTNYCAILAGEYESDQDTSVVSSITSTNEFSDLLVRAGANNRFKTVNGFRIESLKQRESNNSWSLDYASLTDPNGHTERIHFMVFGGGTYGQV